MKLEAGRVYRIEIPAEGTRADFVLQELHQYQGQYILYGYTRAHMRRNIKGLFLAQERSGHGIYFPGEQPQTVVALSKSQGGYEIYLHDELEKIALFNRRVLWRDWGKGGTEDKSRHLNLAMNEVDAYMSYKTTGVWH